jgi:hypothetical protein
MKRFWLLLTVIVSSCCLLTCSSDDDEPVVKDKILGKWQLSDEYLNGIRIPLSECELEMTIEFFDSGTYSEKDFEYDEDNDICTGLPVKTGTWEYLGDSNYYLSDIGVESLKITFSGNTMTVSYSESIEDIVLELRVIFTKVDS